MTKCAIFIHTDPILHSSGYLIDNLIHFLQFWFDRCSKWTFYVANMIESKVMENHHGPVIMIQFAFYVSSYISIHLFAKIGNLNRRLISQNILALRAASDTHVTSHRYVILIKDCSNYFCKIRNEERSGAFVTLERMREQREPRIVPIKYHTVLLLPRLKQQIVAAQGFAPEIQYYVNKIGHCAGHHRLRWEADDLFAELCLFFIIASHYI